jgi:hypothetical protein
MRRYDEPSLGNAVLEHERHDKLRLESISFSVLMDEAFIGRSKRSGVREYFKPTGGVLLGAAVRCSICCHLRCTSPSAAHSTPARFAQ